MYFSSKCVVLLCNKLSVLRDDRCALDLVLNSGRTYVTVIINVVVR